METTRAALATAEASRPSRSAVEGSPAIFNGFLSRYGGPRGQRRTLIGEPCIAGSGLASTARGLRSLRSCWKDGNTGSPGPLVMVGRCHDVCAGRAAGGAKRKSGRGSEPGRAQAGEVKEPPKHAPGYSRGGFGTKVNLLVTDRGVVLGIDVTPGPQHESTAFEPLMRRVLLRRRPGIPYWPAQLAGDKGWSYRISGLAEATSPRTRHPDTQESTAGGSLRQSHLLPAELGRTGDRLVQGMSGSRHSIRETKRVDKLVLTNCSLVVQ